MRIGIAGTGVAGAYLACMLSSRHEVEVFDRKEKDELRHDCACGFHYSDLRNYCGKCGLNPARYLEHVGRTFSLFGVTVAIEDLTTFNKHRFLIDLLKRDRERATQTREANLLRVKEKTAIFAMPGNPQSCFVVFKILVEPAIARISGARIIPPLTE